MSDQPQRKLAPVVAFMSLNKVLNAGGHIAQLQIAPPAQLVGDIGRDVARPVFGGVDAFRSIPSCADYLYQLRPNIIPIAGIY